MAKTLKAIILFAVGCFIISSNTVGKITDNVLSTDGTLFLTIPAEPQKTKILDSEKKKKPAWIGTLKKDYIIVTGSGPNLDAAQQNGLMKVKESIVRAVAENVTVKTEMTTKEQMGTNVSNFFQDYEQTTQAQTADLEFIKGISLTKVEDSYWEKLQEGNSTTFYAYLYYPFSSAELSKLVRAYEKADKELTEQMEEVLNRIDSNMVVENMERDISVLEKLLPKFFNNRKAKSEVGIEKLKSRLKSINIVPVSRTLGSIEYELKIGNQTVTTSVKPKVADPNKCANISGIEPSKTGWLISFDAKYCYDDPGNKIKAEHSFRYSKVSHDFAFNVNEGKVEIFINAPIVITATEQDDKTVKSSKAAFTLSNKFDGDFTIDKIILNYKDQLPLIIDNIGQSFSGKNNHTLTVEMPGELDKNTYSSKTTPLIDGLVYYTNKADNKQSIYKIYQNKVTTNW